MRCRTEWDAETEYELPHNWLLVGSAGDVTTWDEGEEVQWVAKGKKEGVEDSGLYAVG